MQIIYSAHASRRMAQRGITSLEVEHILRYPENVRIAEDRITVVGKLNNRTIKIIITRLENIIKIITVM